jgi:outer membrane translocation and assembly module TamA
MTELNLELGYRYDETKWLEANRHLWSLFGGSKLFDWNFARVDSAYREQGIADIDTGTFAGLELTVNYDTRNLDEPFISSAWAVTANLEWSHPDFSSDFDYRRYTINTRRYQRLNRHTMIIGRLVFGGSDGVLPMNKRFFLGGLGTLRGYSHKELVGTRFWMTNLEYRFQFPRSSIAVAVIYDAAQIANEAKLNDDIELKQSIGVAAYLGNDTRISLAKRLDRSFDDTPKFYVRLSHVL